MTEFEESEDLMEEALGTTDGAAGGAHVGVADRVSFHVRDASDPALEGRYDLAVAFECSHDMGRPVEALRAMRRLVGESGAVIVADEPSVGTGTVMRPPTLRSYAKDAGYADVEVLPIENDLWRFYRLIP